MARTKDPHAATLKAWQTRGRALPGSGSSPTQIRSDVYRSQEWQDMERTFENPSHRLHTTEEDVRSHTRTHFGRELSRNDLADLAGAPPGSNVEIDIPVLGWGEDSVGVKVTFPDGAGECDRVIKLKDRTIYNNEAHVRRDKAGKGIGTAMLELEVETAARLGMKKIEVMAVGSKKSGVNGYYSWAAMGFEADKPVRGPKGPTSLHALMSEPGGRAWWQENGESFNGTFDLTPGSKSMRVFEEYRRLKKEQMLAARMAQFRPGQEWQARW